MKKGKRRKRKTGDPSNEGFLRPWDKVPHECKYAGRCCVSSIATLTPFDVWRMVTSPAEPLARYGVASTTELFESGLASYHYDESVTPYPVAGINFQEFEGQAGAVKVCPFLEYRREIPDVQRAELLDGKVPRSTKFWFGDDGPAFECGLGDDRPVQCEFFPVGILVGSEGHFRISGDDSECRRCMPTQILHDRPTAAKWADPSDKRRSLFVRMAGEYAALVNRMAARPLPDMAGKFAARLLFDFDRFSEDAGVDLVEGRPKDPGEMYESVRVLLDSIDVPSGS